MPAFQLLHNSQPPINLAFSPRVSQLTNKVQFDANTHVKPCKSTAEKNIFPVLTTRVIWGGSSKILAEIQQKAPSNGRA